MIIIKTKSTINGIKIHYIASLVPHCELQYPFHPLVSIARYVKKLNCFITSDLIVLNAHQTSDRALQSPYTAIEHFHPHSSRSHLQMFRVNLRCLAALQHPSVQTVPRDDS